MIQFINYSDALPFSRESRERWIKEGLEKLETYSYNEEGHRFHYMACGDTLIFIFQAKGEKPRLWDAKVRRVGYVTE